MTAFKDARCHKCKELKPCDVSGYTINWLCRDCRPSLEKCRDRMNFMRNIAMLLCVQSLKKASQKAKRRVAAKTRRQAKADLMGSLGLVRGKDSRGRELWE